MEIKDLTIPLGSSIQSAMKQLDQTAKGILFVVDKENKLLGSLTDGDIRRKIMVDANNMSAPVDMAMNQNYISLPVESENPAILEKLSDSIKIIPLVDENNTLVDFASIYKLRRISVAEPLMKGNELEYVTDCIRSNWISSIGKYVTEFENIFSKKHLDFNALTVANGTTGLHLALVTLGIGKGDEVLVPDMTFAASVNAILYTGAKPVLVDIDPETWTIDLGAAQKALTNKTKAILPVHLYGHPCDMTQLMNFAKVNNLLVVEDCAEALGSTYNDKPVGTFGDAAVFSFFGNKTITTGEGGMILFKDEKNHKLATELRDHGMDKSKRYWHNHIGFNYRLTNIQSAIGLAQMERLDELVNAKRNTAQAYHTRLKNGSFFQLPTELKNCTNTYWLYTLLIKDNAPFNRDELAKHLRAQGIETRPTFYPMHMMPPYENCSKSCDLINSKRIYRQGLSLPSSASLGESEVQFICDVILDFTNKFVSLEPAQ